MSVTQGRRRRVGEIQMAVLPDVGARDEFAYNTVAVDNINV